MRGTITTRFRQCGTAAVETAIVLPFLLFLMLSIAELGRAIVHYNELTKATRDAARYLASSAIVGSTDVIEIDTALEKATRNLVVFGNTRGSGEPVITGLTVEDVSIADVDGLHVRVSVSFDYVPLLGSDTMPMFGNGGTFGLGIPLVASVTMRAL